MNTFSMDNQITRVSYRDHLFLKIDDTFNWHHIIFHAVKNKNGRQISLDVGKGDNLTNHFQSSYYRILLWKCQLPDNKESNIEAV